MTAPWQHLLSNFAIVGLVVSLWVQTQDWTDRWDARVRHAALGLLMGAGAVSVMHLPFEFRPGIFVDLRTALIAISGLFGGPLAAFIAAGMAIIYRISEGGPGATAGVSGIVLAMSMGLAGRYVFGTHLPSRRQTVLFALATTVFGTLNYFALPSAIWPDMFKHVVPVTSVLVFISTLISALAIVQEARRREAFQTNHLYRALIEALPDCLNIKDADGRFLIANPATAELMHAPSADGLIGKTDFDFYPSETASSFRKVEERILADGSMETMEQRIERENGEIVWLSTLKAPIHNLAGGLAGVITHNRDVTYRKTLELQLAESRNRLAEALASMSDALVMFDRNQRLVFCNPQYLAFFNRTADLRVPGASFREILEASVERGEAGPLSECEAKDWVNETLAASLVPGDKEVQLEDGRWLLARASSSLDGSTMIVMTDVTRRKNAENQLRSANRQLETLSRTDVLTELVNRRGFDEALEVEFSRSLRSKIPLSLLFVDIDRFKLFNDRNGHQAGDEVLRRIGRCFKRTMRRPSDMAARYGGEELVAILPDTSESGALQLAETFRNAVRDLAIPTAPGESTFVSVSVGVATSGAGHPVASRRELVERADEALYEAKTSGRDRVLAWRSRLEATA